MRDINPNSGKSAFAEKAWHADNRDQLIGFINRDAEVSETIAAPNLINPMGTVYSYRMADLENASTSAGSKYVTWSKVSSYMKSAPGILVAEFLPVFGSASDYFRGGMRSIFIDKWTEFRQIYSGVESFQPGDLQAVTAQIMNLKMHMAHLQRTLRIAQTATASGDSKFSMPEILLSASGWAISAMTARRKYVEWHNKYNYMAATFNKLNWIKDLVPGNDRWAALCQNIYKDTSADTDYCQLYLFRPRSYYKLSTTTDSQGIVTWSLKPEGNYYQQNTTDEDTAVTLFEEYMQQIYDDIINLYYDSSVQQIVSTLVQIEKITKEQELEPLDVPYLDMTPQPLAYTWDFPVMLALHNASIVDVNVSATESVAVVNGKVGTFEQEINCPGVSQDIGTAMATLPKIINLPCFAPTNADIANATQWTIVTDKLHGDTNILDPSAYGTEIICRVYIGYFTLGQASTPYFTMIRWHQGSCLTETNVSFPVSTSLQVNSYILGSNFAYIPLIYDCAKNNSGSGAPWYACNVHGQLEVMYGVSFATLKAIHDAWTSNFWGFPVNVPRTGTVQLETDKT